MRSVLLLCFSVQSIIRNLFALFYSYKFCMYPQNLNLYKNELIANLERAATNVNQGSRAAPNRRPTPTTAQSVPGGPNWQTDIQSRSRAASGRPQLADSFQSRTMIFWSPEAIPCDGLTSWGLFQMIGRRALYQLQMVGAASRAARNGWCGVGPLQMVGAASRATENGWCGVWAAPNGWGRV